MNCPTDKSALERRELMGVEVDACGSCGGVWLEAGELRELQTAYKAAHADEAPPPTDEADAVIGAYELAEQQARDPRDCPRCGDGMEQVEYAYTSQVMVDRCVHGHGLWLDAGELTALEQFFETQRRAAQRSGLMGVWRRLLKEIDSGMP